MPTPRPPAVTWESLNERQRTYLTLLYHEDQAQEKYQRSAWTQGGRAQPADEWRWIFYGDTEVGPSAYKRTLQRAKLVDPGTGSTFEALRSRDLLLVRSYHGPYVRGDDAVYLRMTPAGRKLVRAATGEPREKRQPPGTLREWHWRALVELYRAGRIERDTNYRYYGVDRAETHDGRPWDLGTTDDTIRRLEDYTRGALCQSSRMLGDPWSYAYEITPFGREYYETEWARYQALYPNVEAPQP